MHSTLQKKSIFVRLKSKNFKQMKKLPLILNIVLFLAVAVLFYFQFSSPGKAVKEQSGTFYSPDTSGFVIAYIEFDTILMNYEMFIDLQDELMKKQTKAEAELNSKLQSWEKRAADYQDKMSKGLITRTNAMQIEQNLGQEQQDIIQLRDQMTRQLAEEATVMERQVRYAIVEFLEEYNKDKNFKYILGKSFGSNVMYASTSLDISSEVLEGLNKKYQEQEKK